MKTNGRGKRFNDNKPRHDLITPNALDGLAGVITDGAIKYGERNWEKGMFWSKVTASLKRHLLAFEQGEDFDEESGRLHVDHLLANAWFLSEYYRTYPQGDDRHVVRLGDGRIGLDIDEVICDWTGGFAEKYPQFPRRPTSWRFGYNVKECLEGIEDLEGFYSSLEPSLSPDDLPFEPAVYITSRPVASEISSQWLERHGFPCAPVVTVGLGGSKLQAVKSWALDYFVDDSYANFRELRDDGFACWLWDAPHNQRYNVGHWRISDFSKFA